MPITLRRSSRPAARKHTAQAAAPRSAALFSPALFSAALFSAALFSAALFSAALFSVSPLAAEPPAGDSSPKPPAADALFAHRVLPLLQSKCFACHGKDEKEVRGRFNMLTREGLLRGGESGEPSLTPGRPEASPLFKAIQWDGLEMPPKQSDRLTADQIEQVRQWIAGGAPWPDAMRLAELTQTPDPWAAAEGVSVRTSGGLSAEWTNRRYPPDSLWAYQPLWRDDGSLLGGTTRHPIDVLIERRLAELELAPAPPASRRVLLRRATFDLIGLPPSPQELEEFEADPAPDAEAFAKVVERLLDSPHYGEHWGRHWLDVVRYADSSGYSNDFERGNAWRYRDYVVRAMNDDKPYDQFIREQLAGDELLPAGDAGASGSELLIAVGWLRMGPWELTGMEVPKVARQRFLDDVTDAVGQVFLGHMLQCARCHDHKFDPIPTRDYYSLQAVFATTQMAERPAPFLPSENLAGFEERKYLEQRREFYLRTQRELESKRSLDAAREWLRANNVDAAEFEAVVAGARRGRAEPKLEVVRALLKRRNVDAAAIPPRHVGFEPRDFGLERIARKGLERLAWRMERYEPIAISVYSGRTPPLSAVTAPLRMPVDPLRDGELERTAILTGGDPFSPGSAVVPAVLSAVSPGAPDGEGGPAELPDAIVGRRAALADWIASPQNPLTARVMVNRIWQWHFGQPIAGTPNNFGATGKRPTHPQLLDFLAGEFVKDGWSVKAMHRLIMRSDAYRRSGQHPDPEACRQRDPAGVSCAAFRPRRLTAEELRDAMLFVSGQLNLEVGGIPNRPEMNLEAAMQPRQVMGTFAEAWQPSPLPAQRNRRSLYALRLRGQRDPFLEVFNSPSSELSCEARDATTVTPQVFALFNSESSFDRAVALAERLALERRTPPQTIRRLFALTLGREPREDEAQACLEHWNAMSERHQRLKFAAPEVLRSVKRDAVEENTGERFEFFEPLEFYADFVPDRKASDVGPDIRGLAEVGLVLLNSNEFLYVE